MSLANGNMLGSSEPKAEIIEAAVEIFRVIKVKVHEFDCSGTHLLNLRFGNDVVQFLRHLNIIFNDSSDKEDFLYFLKIEYKNINKKKRDYINTLKKMMKEIPHKSPEELRMTYLNEIKKSEDLVTRRFNSFKVYLKFLIEQNLNIAEAIDLIDDLNNIEDLVSKTMQALNKNKKAISKIVDNDQLRTYLANELTKANKIIECQCDNILDHLISINLMIRDVIRSIDKHSKRIMKDTTGLFTKEELLFELLDEEDEYLEQEILHEPTVKFAAQEFGESTDSSCNNDVGYTKRTLETVMLPALTQCAFKLIANPNYLLHKISQNNKTCCEKLMRKTDIVKDSLKEMRNFCYRNWKSCMKKYSMDTKYLRLN